MNPRDITIVTGIDIGYIDKLLATYETWKHFKPEVLKMPMRVVYDTATLALDGRRMRRLAKAARRQADFQFVPWEGEYPSQREKMLTALTFAPTTDVPTPWYLKIDADTVATRTAKWIDDAWFEEKDGETPAFVTNPWNYTKPASFITRLQDWGDQQPGLKDHPRLQIEYSPDDRRAYHKRIISWLFFGNVAWTREVVGTLPTRNLPVPSQDTFLWYCAARTDRRYVTHKMRRCGWGHMGRTSTSAIADECRSLIDE